MPSNRVYELLQEVCRGSTGCFRHFYRKFRSSTGCSIIGFQVVGEWKKAAWMDREVGEGFVMT